MRKKNTSLQDIFFNKKIFIGALVFILAFVALQTFSGFKTQSFSKSFNTVSSGIAVMDKASSEYYREGAGAPSNDLPASTGDIDVSQRQVIRNASLDIVVRRVDSAVSSLKATAYDLGGFVQNIDISDTDTRPRPLKEGYAEKENSKSGYVVFRVPSDNLEEALRRVKLEAVKVFRENVTSSDVTERYIDLEAQLTNLTREEDAYLGVLDKAESIEDILKVSSRLSNVRGKIERIQGQINYLSRSIDMSTITVSLVSEADVEVFGVVWSPLVVIKEAVQKMITGVIEYLNAFIRILFALPVVALWIVTFGIIFLLMFKIIGIIVRKMLKK
ncbi:MAG: DUF4349 domain-containing protein [Candidatus Pacebacteria bacterium]|nr:DUF4349 domain-containing protein [Candidatus Paceibacterota bacterium]